MKNVNKKAFLILLVSFSSSIWALSPPNINSNISWTDSGGSGNGASFNGVSDIELAFNNGRRGEETQLGLSVNTLGTLDLPTQVDWDKMTDDAKALFILNDERQDRAGMQTGVIGLPLAGIESHIDHIAKNYGDLLHDTDTTGHSQSSANQNLDGPAIRIEQDADIGSLHKGEINYTASSSAKHPDGSQHFYADSYNGSGACHEFITRSENLAYFATSGSSIPLPLERGIYGFIYDDAGSAWGHREAALLQDETLSQVGSQWGFSNNHTNSASEGYLGVYVRSSSEYKPFSSFQSNYGSVVVMNIFDPVGSSSTCHYNATLDFTETTTAKGKVPTLSIPNNTWMQIGLNTDAASGSTAAEIIGDDISGVYDTDWVVFSYQTNTNSYQKLSLSSTMLPGVGYWIIQKTGNAVVVDMPSSSSGVYVTHTPACSSTEGCFEIPLQVNASQAQWQMIGYSFRDNRNMDLVKVVTNSSTACSTGCTLSEAAAAGLIQGKIWHYTGTVYAELTNNGSDVINPWDGGWVSILPGAAGSDPKLLFPAN